MLNVEIDKIKEGAVFKDEHGNAEDEMPLFGFVMKSEHAQKNSPTPKKSGHKKKHAFGNSFCPHFSRAIFIQKHYQESYRINSEEKNNNAK